MNPYFTERLAKEHRDDLLRAAEASRFVHSVEIKARSQRWWSPLLRFRFRSTLRGGHQRGSGLVRDSGLWLTYDGTPGENPIANLTQPESSPPRPEATAFPSPGRPGPFGRVHHACPRE